MSTDAEDYEFRELDEQLTIAKLQVSRYKDNYSSNGVVSIIDQVFINFLQNINNFLFSGFVLMLGILLEHMYQHSAIEFMKIERFWALIPKPHSIACVPTIKMNVNNQQNGLLSMINL